MAAGISSMLIRPHKAIQSRAIYSHHPQIGVPCSKIDKFPKMSAVRGGWISSEIIHMSDRNFVALHGTLPRRIRLSFILWNKQFPSPGVGGWRYVSPTFPTSFSNRLFGDAPLSEACWQSVIHWKTSGKSSLRKADARFNKAIAISVRGS